MSKIFFALPSFRGIVFPEFKESFERTVNTCHKFGHQTSYAIYKHNCYLPLLRNNAVRDFMKTSGDVMFFLDDDLSWPAEAAIKLLELEGDIVAGAYRMKCEQPLFPVCLDLKDIDGGKEVIFRDDGCVKALRMPTGFMRINRSMIEKMIEHYPERKYTDITFDQGEAEAAWDLFPCGLATAPDGSRHWDGEDTGFCRLWAEMGGEMWIYPDIIFNHYSEEKYYRGNYKQFLEAQIVVIPETKAA